MSKSANALWMIVFLAISHTGFSDTLEQEMNKASDTLMELMPYIYNDSAFRDPTNQDKIQQQLQQLLWVIEQTPKFIPGHGVNMKISQQSLVQQLKQAKLLFETKNYATAQFLLSGVPVICSSCHIQDGQQAKLTRKLDRSLFANDFSYGEFNYYLRHYTQAQISYLAYLDKPSVQKSRIQSERTLRRLLDIAILSHEDTQKAQIVLSEHTKLPKLNLEVRKKIELWQEGLRSIEPTMMNLDQLEASIYENFNERFSLQHEFIFNERNRPSALYWRKQLHQLLRRPNTKVDTARVLYLLSIMERTLGDQIDVSLANLYLKECARMAVASYSSKCLNEYENHLYFYFGGSNGEGLPPALINELDALKQNSVNEI